jgi:F0F1-type ATP synthase epsilon subunit
MKVRILTSQENLLEMEAREAILPGEDGQFSVWDFHQAFLHCLRGGAITLVGRHSSGKEATRLLISTGIARLISNELVIMVEKAL